MYERAVRICIHIHEFNKFIDNKKSNKVEFQSLCYREFWVLTRVLLPRSFLKDKAKPNSIISELLSKRFDSKYYQFVFICEAKAERLVRPCLFIRKCIGSKNYWPKSPKIHKLKISKTLTGPVWQNNIRAKRQNWGEKEQSSK